MRTFLDALRAKLAGVARRLRAFSFRLAGRTTRVASPPTKSGGDDKSPGARSSDGTSALTGAANAGAPGTTQCSGSPKEDSGQPAVDANDHVVDEEHGPGAVRSDGLKTEAAAEPEAPAARDRRGPDEQTGTTESESETATAEGDAEKSPAFAAKRKVEASGEEQSPGCTRAAAPMAPRTIQDDQESAPEDARETGAASEDAEASSAVQAGLDASVGDQPSASIGVVAGPEPPSTPWTVHNREPALEPVTDAPAAQAASEKSEGPAALAAAEQSQLDRTPSHTMPVGYPQPAAPRSEGETPGVALGPGTLETSVSPEHVGDQTNGQEASIDATAPPAEAREEDRAAGEALDARAAVEGGHVPSSVSGDPSAPSPDDASPEAAPDANAASPSEREPSQLPLGRADADFSDDGGESQGSHGGGDGQHDAGAVAASGRGTVDRGRARIDPEELGRAAVVSAPALDDVDYLVWNRALAKHCLLGDEVDEVLYLTVTPTILAAALSEVQPGRFLPEDAEAAFVTSVAAVYRGRVLEHRQRLQILRRCGADGLPDCIAFLAASVLAAYQMRSDEEAAAAAYYSRLAELLTCDLSGGHPRGFDPDEFEALWHFLNAWLRAEKGRRLALPGPDVGLRRFVALPLTHVPLRRVDIERLPEFFAWAGYEPGARIARTKLDQDLVSWSLGRTPFTSTGMAALADERRAAVLAQIAHELESWDGAHIDSLGRRSGRVEILLDVVQRRPELFYLPRRPAAFPQVFDDGAHAFEASDEGWYDPVPLGSEDGQALSEGFEWQVIAGRLRLVLHRPGARAIALPASHEYTGYLSHRALQLGAPAAALCRETLAQSASEYLSEISQQRCVPINHPGLPEGWRLFTGIKPQRRGETPPAGLEALAVEAAVDLIPTGGLRLGGRWAWVVGAPPRLIVAGLDVGEKVTIDGEPVAVADDGTLAGNGALARPGTHIIAAAGLRRRVEITEPQVQGEPWNPPPPRTVLALPRGTWTLVGAEPGEVAVPMFRSSTGAVASCSFPVVWAIEAGAGPGARVLCLSVPAPPPRRARRLAPHGGEGLAWASVIYNAAIRRPRMATLDGQTCLPDDYAVWAEYARAAREIKRRFRRARR